MANATDVNADQNIVSTSSIILTIAALLMSAFITFVNVLTIVVIRKTPSLWTLSNMYITSLAISDLVVGLCLIPLSLFFIPPTRKYLFDQNIKLCVLVFGINLGVAVVSNINQTLIATDRYIYITRPYAYKRLVTQRTVFILLASAWGLGVIYALLPQFIHQEGVQSCDVTLVMPVWYLFYTNLTLYSTLVITDLVLYSHILYVAYRQHRLIAVLSTVFDVPAQSPVIPSNLECQLKGSPSVDHNITQCSISSQHNEIHSNNVYPSGSVRALHLERKDLKNLPNSSTSTGLSQSRALMGPSHSGTLTICKISPLSVSPQNEENIQNLSKQARKTSVSQKTASKKPISQGYQRLKSVKFFMTVFGAYFICLTPTVVCMGLDYYIPVPKFVYNLFNLLALLNSGINFLIYLTLNARFKISVLRYVGISKKYFTDFTKASNFDV